MNPSELAEIRKRHDAAESDWKERNTFAFIPQSHHHRAKLLAHVETVRNEAIAEALAVIIERRDGNKAHAGKYPAHSPTFNQWVNASLECDVLFGRIAALKGQTPSEGEK